MVSSAAESPVRRRMSYEDYQALPATARAEWVDGEVVMNPSPSYKHQQAARRVANLLEQSLRELTVVEAVTVVMGARERIPDVTVITSPPEGAHVTELPLAVVEVLSPGNRNEDTVVKSPEYLTAGVSQYWLVDPIGRVVEVFENAGTYWRALVRLDDGHPTGAVHVARHGTVHLDLPALFGPPTEE